MLHPRIPTGLLALLAMLVCTAAQAQEFGTLAAPSASDKAVPLPLSNAESLGRQAKPMSYAQQKAVFEDQQRLMRMEFNRMIGYSPLRPNINASFSSYSPNRYYLPRRDAIVLPGYNSWYW